MKVSEPAAAYIDETNDEEKLQQCLELLHSDSMPCVFTDKEFKRELKESEASGNASDEEVKTLFAKWGL